MTTLFLAALMGLASKHDEPISHTPAVYWFPASEGIEKWLPRLADEELFDTWIADPKPNPATLEAAKGKVHFVSPSTAYTTANMKWRDATLKLVRGEISPAAWLNRTNGLGETLHYLTTPKTPNLRSLTAKIENGLGSYSGRAVFGETLICYLPGKPCFYSTDLFLTNYFPQDSQYESWILAMNDYVGPMLSLRVDYPKLCTQKPKILRADNIPGMLIFSQKIGPKTFTFYFNNGLKPLALPKAFHTQSAIMPRGLDLDTPAGPFLLGSGTALTIDPPDK